MTSPTPQDWISEYETWDSPRGGVERVAGDKHFSLVRGEGARGDQIFRKAGHHVGLFPYRFKTLPQNVLGAVDDDSAPALAPATGVQHGVLAVVPKGAKRGDADSAKQALWRFSQLLALVFRGEDAATDLDEDLRWQGQGRSVADMTLLLLAQAYAATLADLCRFDFRRFYRSQEEVLVGRVRGRLQLHRHMRNTLNGRPHHMPCVWDEFTADNWDNRLLAAAMDAVITTSRRLTTELPGPSGVESLFAPVQPYFQEVERQGVTGADLPRARLARVSSRYGRSLELAGQLLRGIDDVQGAGLNAGIWLDANAVFEKFAEQVVSAALAAAGLSVIGDKSQRSETGLLEGGPKIRPDIYLETTEGVLAVGDAKYKEVCGLVDSPDSDPSEGWDLTIAKMNIKVQLKSADLYQMYAYMRLSNAPLGFFVVPFWRSGADPAFWHVPSPLGFRPSPRHGAVSTDRVSGDSDHQLAVLGLNMMVPPREALESGARQLADHLKNSNNQSQSPAPSPSVPAPPPHHAATPTTASPSAAARTNATVAGSR